MEGINGRDGSLTETKGGSRVNLTGGGWLTTPSAMPTESQNLTSQGGVFKNNWDLLLFTVCLLGWILSWLSCGTQNLRSSLQHVRFLVAVCGI